MNSCAEGENDEMGIPNSRERSRLKKVKKVLEAVVQRYSSK